MATEGFRVPSSVGWDLQFGLVGLRFGSYRVWGYRSQCPFGLPVYVPALALKCFVACRDMGPEESA